MKSCRGYSLPELLVVVGIIFIVLIAVFSYQIIAGKHWDTGTRFMDLSSGLRYALTVMSDEISQTSVSHIEEVPADGNWYPSISIKVPHDNDGDGTPFQAGTSNLEWSTPIRFYKTEDGKVVRGQDSQTRTLVTNITYLGFRRTSLEPNIIEISITGQKSTKFQGSISFNLKDRVCLRN